MCLESLRFHKSPLSRVAESSYKHRRTENMWYASFASRKHVFGFLPLFSYCFFSFLVAVLKTEEINFNPHIYLHQELSFFLTSMRHQDALCLKDGDRADQRLPQAFITTM